MEAAFAELPLAVFTTLAPIGAGAFIALAVAFLAAEFTPEQLKRIDRMSILPYVIAAAGFIASALHVATPAHAVWTFTGLGSSPLSNEVAVGGVFMVVALVYLVCALTGRLSIGARKAFAAVVAVLALVFACFTGLAYLMPTIASWSTPLLPVEMVGFSLAGGAALGAFTLGCAGALTGDAVKALKVPLATLALAGVVIAVAAFAAHVSMVSGMQNATTSGASLVDAAMPFVIAGVVCIVLGGVAMLLALAGKQATVIAACATVLLVAGVFVARMAFYALQLSVGLSL